MTKGFKGGFKDTQLDYIVYSLLKQLVERSQIDPALIEDVSLGNVRNHRIFYLYSGQIC